MFYLLLISKSQKANECSSGHFNWLINMNIFINKILTFFFLFFCYVETNKCILLDWDAKKARCSEELLLINYHNFLTEFFKIDCFLFKSDCFLFIIIIKHIFLIICIYLFNHMYIYLIENQRFIIQNRICRDTIAERIGTFFKCPFSWNG